MAETEIPFFDFSEIADLKEGSEGWKAICNKLREACEEYGCFQASYGKNIMHRHEEMFKAAKSLFDLPEETKQKNLDTRAYSGYLPNSDDHPFHQCLGIDDAHLLHGAKAFAETMWPQGNPDVCRAVHSMGADMMDLHLLVIKMIFESFGLGKYYASHVESIDTVLKLMKYDTPPSSQDSLQALLPHTDKTITTILGQDEVQGLQVLTRRGNWVKVQPLPGVFTVLLGEMLKVMSNGRLEGTTHKVVMSEDKDRYSYGLFLTFKEGVVVEVPSEFVDEEHPPLYRPFNYNDFLRYFKTNYNENALQVYAGV